MPITLGERKEPDDRERWFKLRRIIGDSEPTTGSLISRIVVKLVMTTGHSIIALK